jgi:hypothetical protein
MVLLEGDLRLWSSSRAISYVWQFRVIHCFHWRRLAPGAGRSGGGLRFSNLKQALKIDSALRVSLLEERRRIDSGWTCLRRRLGVPPPWEPAVSTFDALSRQR